MDRRLLLARAHYALFNKRNDWKKGARVEDNRVTFDKEKIRVTFFNSRTPKINAVIEIYNNDTREAIK